MLKTRYAIVFVILFTVVSFCNAITITLEWEPVQTTVSGEPLGADRYYKLLYGSTSGDYFRSIVVTNGARAHLTLEYNKTFFFCVKTCTDSGESAFSEALLWTAPVMPDIDFDGLSDDWETFYFGSLSRAGSNTDTDGNGVNDLEEFIAGTDPLNASDGTSLAISSSGTINFLARQATGSGYENRIRRYRLLHSGSLADADWVPVPDMDGIAAEGQLVSCDLPAKSSVGYYRTETYLD